MNITENLYGFGTCVSEYLPSFMTPVWESVCEAGSTLMATKGLFKKSLKVLVSGMIYEGNGDYIKQAKICKMITDAGHVCRVEQHTITADSYIKFGLGDNLIQPSEIEAFDPDIMLNSPLGFFNEDEKRSAKMNITTYAIEEYGTNCRKPADIEGAKYTCLRSGFDEMGLILDNPYVKSYDNPIEHLSELPPLYQEAITGGDLKAFDQSTDFYFGYAFKPHNLGIFMKGVLHYRNTSPASTHKDDLCFYFMPSKFRFNIESFYEDFKELGVGTLSINYVNTDKETKEIKLSDDPTATDIKVVIGKTDHQDVYPLMHAAKDVSLTGDESLAEAYATKKVPLHYETLRHKIPFRKQQLELIFGDMPQYSHLVDTVVDMTRPQSTYTFETVAELLNAKEDPAVQARLDEHLDFVHSELNFEDNLIKLLDSHS